MCCLQHSLWLINDTQKPNFIHSFITNGIYFCLLSHCRSSYSCCYFVLPCCFFDFYGKYQRRQCNRSQYKEYIDFVTEVSQVCGFNTEEDCLRIPSTKRVGSQSQNWTTQIVCLTLTIFKTFLSCVIDTNYSFGFFSRLSKTNSFWAISSLFCS